MKINSLDFYVVAVQDEEFAETRRTLFVRVATDRATVGWGEAALEGSSDDWAARRSAVESLLEGRNIFDLEELHELETMNPPVLRSAVEMALWDLIGRTLKQPVYNLLGGRYRPRIAVAIRLPPGTPERMGQAARELAAQGYHTHIISAVGRMEEDVERVIEVRENVGAEVELRLDCRGLYAVESARDLCAALEEHDLQFLLDPLGTREFFPSAALGRETTVPLAFGRSIRSPADMLAVVRCGAGKFAVLDLSQLGGLMPVKRCAAVASAGHTRLLMNGRTFLGPGTAAMLHLAASTSAMNESHECSSVSLYDFFLEDSFTLISGMISVPPGPGFGIEVDREKVEKYQV
jgi:L-alanine-DL-glutamate epimerase-like enolase superfamily enzyme